MLIADIHIYINLEEIANLRIINMGKKNKEGETLYKVKDKHRDDFCVYHRRSSGWEPLVIKALEKRR